MIKYFTILKESGFVKLIRQRGHILVELAILQFISTKSQNKIDNIKAERRRKHLFSDKNPSSAGKKNKNFCPSSAVDPNETTKHFACVAIWPDDCPPSTADADNLSGENNVFDFAGQKSIVGARLYKEDK
jgi:hypothetical protein